MTKEELAKIPFKTGGHLALEGEYRQNYYNEQYGFALVDITKRSSQGFVAGKTRREYLYQGKRYRSMDKLEHQYAGMTMQGIIARHNVDFDMVVEWSADLAHALVEKMKEERK